MTRVLGVALVLIASACGGGDPCELEASSSPEPLGTLPLSGNNPRIGAFVPHPDGGGAFPVLTDSFNDEKRLIRIDAEGAPSWTAGREVDPFRALDLPPHAAWGPEGWILAWANDGTDAEIVRIDDEGELTDLPPLPWGGTRLSLGWTGSSFLFKQDDVQNPTSLHILAPDGSVQSGPFAADGYNFGYIRTVVGGDERGAFLGDAAVTFVDATGVRLGGLVADQNRGLFGLHVAPDGQGWQTARIITVDHSTRQGLGVYSYNGGAIEHQRLDAQAEPDGRARVEVMLGENVWPSFVMLSRDGTATVFVDDEGRLGVYANDASRDEETCRVRATAQGTPFDARRVGDVLTVWSREGKELFSWTVDLGRAPPD